MSLLTIIRFTFDIKDMQYKFSYLSNPIQIGEVLIQEQSWKKPLATVQDEITRFHTRDKHVPYLQDQHFTRIRLNYFYTLNNYEQVITLHQNMKWCITSTSATKLTPQATHQKRSGPISSSIYCKFHKIKLSVKGTSYLLTMNMKWNQVKPFFITFALLV